jgi:hypothetical protein
LGERVVRNDEVSGSIPLSSTKHFTENHDEFARPTGLVISRSAACERIA